MNLFEKKIDQWVEHNYEKLNNNKKHKFFRDYKLAKDNSIIVDDIIFIFHFGTYNDALITSVKYGIKNYIDFFLEKVADINANKIEYTSNIHQIFTSLKLASKTN